MNILRNKIFLVALILIIIFVILNFLPLQFSYKVSTAGKVFSARTWLVGKGNSGQLITYLHDRRKGIVDQYSVKEFQRGDDIHLVLKEDLRIGKSIGLYDTVGVLLSNELDKQILELKNELEVSKASLAFYKTGEKESVVKQARENYNYYLKQGEELRIKLARLEALREKDLVSQEEYELTLNLVELNKISTEINKAALETVSTGAKQEQIDLITKQIESIKQQIEVLEKRAGNQNLISPIQGVVSNLSIGDTLFAVSDNTEYIIVIPVRINEAIHVYENMAVKLKFPSSSIKLKGNIIFIDNIVYNVLGEQVIFATANIYDPENLITVPLGKKPGSANPNRLRNFVNGLMIECEMDGGSTGFWGYIKKFMGRNIF